MRSLVIFYNETERWVNVLTYDVAPDGMDYKIVDSTTHYPNGSLLNFATSYHTNVGVNEDRVNVFRTEKVGLIGNDHTWKN